MLSLRTLLNLTPRSLRVAPSANVMWPAKFEEPLKSREEIGQIQKTPEYERKVNVPVKAAAQDASCSMFQDPLLQKFIKICTVTSSAQLGEQIWLETCRRIKVLTILLLFIYSFDLVIIPGDSIGQILCCFRGQEKRYRAEPLSYNQRCH